MGPRPARCECRSRHEAAAGSRNPSCRASAFCTSYINDLQWFVKSKATFAGKPSQSSLRDASSPEGGAFRPLRHGLRRATSPKGRGKKRSRHALGSPLGRAAERSEAERAWPLKTARAQNLSQKRFRFVEISSPSRAVEQRLPLRGQLSPQVTERVPRTTKTPHTVVAHCVRGSDSAFRQISRYQLLWCTPQINSNP